MAAQRELHAVNLDLAFVRHWKAPSPLTKRGTYLPRRVEDYHIFNDLSMSFATRITSEMTLFSEIQAQKKGVLNLSDSLSRKTLKVIEKDSATAQPLPQAQLCCNKLPRPPSAVAVFPKRRRACRHVPCCRQQYGRGLLPQFPEGNWFAQRTSPESWTGTRGP